MPRALLTALLLLVLVSFTSYRIMHIVHNGKTAKISGSNTGFAVVELFTSEGCSSCPPADEAVAQLLTTGEDNVYVLGFHVDYWNSLGWKDAYSNASYSARQGDYGRIFRLNSVYTPQAIVNGKSEFTGSDTRRLHDEVKEALNGPASSPIQILAKSDGKTVTVEYGLQALPQEILLNIALVQLHAQTNVQRGENSGRVLNHVNVVRAFKTVSCKQAQGNITLEMPDGLAAEGCRIIAYTQDAGWKITTATQAPVR